MDVSSVSRQYGAKAQPSPPSDDAQQAQNRAVRQQQETAAKKLAQTASSPVVNGQGQTIGRVLNTKA